MLQSLTVYIGDGKESDNILKFFSKVRSAANILTSNSLLTFIISSFNCLMQWVLPKSSDERNAIDFLICCSDLPLFLKKH